MLRVPDTVRSSEEGEDKNGHADLVHDAGRGEASPSEAAAPEAFLLCSANHPMTLWENPETSCRS